MLNEFIGRSPRLFSLTSMALLALMLFSLAGCAPDPRDAECAGGWLHRRCTITDGSHNGFVIGMSKEDAFDVACQRERNGQLNIDQFPILYVNGEMEFYPQTSICDLETEAMVAEGWTLMETVWIRERRVTLEFGARGLEKIKANLSGMDP